MSVCIVLQLGLEPYHSVGILGFNSVEWFASSLGAMFAGYEHTHSYRILITTSSACNSYATKRLHACAT